MKRAGTLLIAAVLLLTLCACKRETRPAVGLGTFHGEQVSVYGGDWQPIGEVYSGQTYLTLNAGGEGVFCVDGEAAAVEWETSGERLTLTMGSARCEGTIDANTVTIGFFDADIRMSFSRTASAALPLLDVCRSRHRSRTRMQSRITRPIGPGIGTAGTLLPMRARSCNT